MNRSILIAAFTTVAMGGAQVSAAGDPYVVPSDLTPVSEWADGFTADEAEKFRRAYRARDYIAGNDVTAFMFLNVSEVIPTMVIQRGEGPVARLDNAPMPDIADVVAKTDLGTMSLSSAILDSRSRMQAIAVLHEGKVVYEAYPGMPRGMQHMWNSSSKTITGLLIHLLAEEGLVDLEAPVSAYLEFTRGSPIGKIRVEDLLHQRSGLDFEETHANFSDPTHPLGRGLASAMTARGVALGPSTKDLVTQVESHRPPKTAFEYSSFNTQVLGFIIERVTKRPWNRVVSDRIWTKAGMEGDALLAISAAGEGLAAGGFSSTLRDFARYGLLFTPSWKVVSRERVVPKSYLETVYAAVEPAIYRVAFQGRRMVKAFGENDAPIGSSYQWDAVFEDGDLYKAGLGGQAIYVSPQTDTVVVFFSTTWQNSLAMISYARAIVKQKFR